MRGGISHPLSDISILHDSCTDELLDDVKVNKGLNNAPEML